MLTTPHHSSPLTDDDVLALEGISRRTFFRRLEGGVLRRLPDGPHAGTIDPASLSHRARKARFAQSLAAIPVPSSGHPERSASGGEGPASAAQSHLFLPDAVAALKIPAQQKEIVSLRLSLCQQCLNGNWRAQGYARKRDFVYDLAAQHSLSGRSIERWMQKYRATVTRWKPLGDPSVLLDERPGPPPGGHTNDGRQITVIDDWAALDLAHAFVDLKLTMRQAYERLLSIIAERQQAWGPRKIYRVPSYGAVCRLLRRLDPLSQARRNGPAALKAAAGHIQRRYDDLRSLDCIEVDEWITDFMAYDPEHRTRVGRYYLLTLLDTRSTYPLVWTLVEKSKHPGADKERLLNAEINLIVALIREYGVPGMLYSDRGRFRHHVFGGQGSPERARRANPFIAGERDASQANGIFDQLGIRRNLPRQHNPRGSRLERMHGNYALWSRTLSEHGWVGANTAQREITSGDAHIAEHMAWNCGQRDATPLLSAAQVAERVAEMMRMLRERPSEANGLNGASPARVFKDCTPLGGFRRVSDIEIDLATAERHDELIERGGVIATPDKRRYHHPSLELVQGERREVLRSRRDRSFVAVLPARKGEEVIIAPACVRVGCNDPAALAAACEYQARIRKLLAQEGSRGATIGSEAQYRPEAPRAADAIPERDFFDALGEMDGPEPPRTSEEIAEMFLSLESEDDLPQEDRLND